MSQSNAEIAREGFAAIARGDFDAIAEFLDPDVKWHAGNPQDGCQNRKQALRWMRDRPRRGAGTMPELIDVVEAGDRVVVVMQPAASVEDPEPQRTANLTTLPRRQGRRDGALRQRRRRVDRARTRELDAVCLTAAPLEQLRNRDRAADRKQRHSGQQIAQCEAAARRGTQQDHHRAAGEQEDLASRRHA